MHAPYQVLPCAQVVCANSALRGVRRARRAEAGIANLLCARTKLSKVYGKQRGAAGCFSPSHHRCRRRHQLPLLG